MVLGAMGLAEMTRGGRVDRKEVRGAHSNMTSSERRRDQQRRQKNLPEREKVCCYSTEELL